jgi:tRNA-dihydrouridine synthase C
MKLGGGAGPSQQQQRVRQHHSPPPPPPRPDYAALLSRRRASPNGGCPALFLAPMENLADAPVRIALAAAAGGFDEAVTEFIRIPAVAQRPAAAVKGATRGYNAHELSQWGGGGGTPLAAQLMGSCPELLAMAARRLAVDLGAPRIDLNLGCPANSVTGNGAGSTLLKTPERIEKLVASMVAAVEGAAPVTVKLRAGFDDASLLDNNLLAAQAGGAAFVALHPRTKRQAYAGAADWRLIARAKEVLDIPVVRRRFFFFCGQPFGMLGSLPLLLWVEPPLNPKPQTTYKPKT